MRWAGRNDTIPSLTVKHAPDAGQASVSGSQRSGAASSRGQHRRSTRGTCSGRGPTTPLSLIDTASSTPPPGCHPGTPGHRSQNPLRCGPQGSSGRDRSSERSPSRTRMTMAPAPRSVAKRRTRLTPTPMRRTVGTAPGISLGGRREKVPTEEEISGRHHPPRALNQPSDGRRASPTRRCDVVVGRSRGTAKAFAVASDCDSRRGNRRYDRGPRTARA